MRYRKQDHEAAISLFKRAVDIDPQSARAHAGLSYAYSLRVVLFGYPWDWLDSAIDEANAALRLEPYSAEGYAVLGRAYRAKGGYKRAQTAVDKALEPRNRRRGT